MKKTKGKENPALRFSFASLFLPLYQQPDPPFNGQQSQIKGCPYEKTGQPDGRRLNCSAAIYRADKQKDIHTGENHQLEYL